VAEHNVIVAGARTIRVPAATGAKSKGVTVNHTHTKDIQIGQKIVHIGAGVGRSAQADIGIRGSNGPSNVVVPKVHINSAVVGKKQNEASAGVSGLHGASAHAEEYEHDLSLSVKGPFQKNVRQMRAAIRILVRTAAAVSTMLAAMMTVSEAHRLGFTADMRDGDSASLSVAAAPSVGGLWELTGDPVAAPVVGFRGELSSLAILAYDELFLDALHNIAAEALADLRSAPSHAMAAEAAARLVDLSEIVQRPPQYMSANGNQTDGSDASMSLVEPVGLAAALTGFIASRAEVELMDSPGIFASLGLILAHRANVDFIDYPGLSESLSSLVEAAASVANTETRSILANGIVPVVPSAGLYAVDYDGFVVDANPAAEPSAEMGVIDYEGFRSPIELVIQTICSLDAEDAPSMFIAILAMLLQCAADLTTGEISALEHDASLTLALLADAVASVAAELAVADGFIAVGSGGDIDQTESAHMEHIGDIVHTVKGDIMIAPPTWMSQADESFDLTVYCDLSRNGGRYHLASHTRYGLGSTGNLEQTDLLNSLRIAHEVPSPTSAVLLDTQVISSLAADAAMSHGAGAELELLQMISDLAAETSIGIVDAGDLSYIVYADLSALNDAIVSIGAEIELEGHHWIYPAVVGTDAYVVQVWSTEQNRNHLFLDPGIALAPIVSAVANGALLDRLVYADAAWNGATHIVTGSTLDLMDPSTWAYPVQTDEDLYITQVLYAYAAGQYKLEVL